MKILLKLNLKKYTLLIITKKTIDEVLKYLHTALHLSLDLLVDP